MQAGNIVVAIQDVETTHSNVELSFKIGDKIKILHVESGADWFYGESMRTAAKGWFDPHYVNTYKVTSPYEHLEPKEKSQRRNLVFLKIIEEEGKFLSIMRAFLESIVFPILLKDTPFKRTLLEEPSIAVCFNLAQEIYNSCLSFESRISVAQEHQIADIFRQFASSLDLFAQYASNNISVLNSLKAYGKQLSVFLEEATLPETLTIEICLVTPLQHYSKYRIQFEEFVWLSPQDGSHYQALSLALDEVVQKSESVDSRLNEEMNNMTLLQLQNQFTGNPNIFQPGRRVIREGEMEKVRVTTAGTALQAKNYFVHLFNDCIIISHFKVSKSGSHSFKLHKFVPLKGCSVLGVVSDDPSGGYIFRVIPAPDQDQELEASFRVQDENTRKVWMDDILAQITLLTRKARKTKTLAEGMLASSVICSTPGFSPEDLGPICKRIYRYLEEEISVLDVTRQINVVVIQPLINASKGAQLSTSDREEPLLAERTDSSQQLVTAALQQADVQVFLLAAESLVGNLHQLTGAVSNACKSSNWSESIDLASLCSIFTSQKSRILYNQLIQYASTLQVFQRVLRGAVFVEFNRMTFRKLNTSSRGSVSLSGSFGGVAIDEKLEAPKERLDSILSFFKDLKSMLPSSNSHQPHIQSSIVLLEALVKEQGAMLVVRKNFEKLLEIQSSIVESSAKTSADSHQLLTKLASTDRTFLKEGDLKKVCRKANKVFRFFLFSDYLIYAGHLGSNRYSFNRSIDLKTCNVSIHHGKDMKHAFDIYGKEKSFVVLASTDKEREDWFVTLRDAIQMIKSAPLPGPGSGSGGATNGGGHHGASAAASGEEVTSFAPLWVPDSTSDGCAVCQMSFTIFFRRHHCRMCGCLVCNKHSDNKLVLPHLHKTEKHRVCDPCYQMNQNPSSKAASTLDSLPLIPLPPATQTSASLPPPNSPLFSPHLSSSYSPGDISVSPLSSSGPPPKPPKRVRAPPPPPLPLSPPPSDLFDMPSMPPPPVPSFPPPPIPSHRPVSSNPFDSDSTNPFADLSLSQSPPPPRPTRPPSNKKALSSPSSNNNPFGDDDNDADTESDTFKPLSSPQTRPPPPNRPISMRRVPPPPPSTPPPPESFPIPISPPPPENATSSCVPFSEYATPVSPSPPSSTLTPNLENEPTSSSSVSASLLPPPPPSPPPSRETVPSQSSTSSSTPPPPPPPPGPPPPRNNSSPTPTSTPTTSVNGKSVPPPPPSPPPGAPPPRKTDSESTTTSSPTPTPPPPPPPPLTRPPLTRPQTKQVDDSDDPPPPPSDEDDEGKVSSVPSHSPVPPRPSPTSPLPSGRPMSFLDSIQRGTSLKTPTPTPTSSSPSKGGSGGGSGKGLNLLDQIKAGKPLKSVQDDHPRMKTEAPPPAKAANSLLDSLATEMFKRRMFLQQEASDSEASGFSDSDSDDD